MITLRKKSKARNKSCLKFAHAKGFSGGTCLSLYNIHLNKCLTVTFIYQVLFYIFWYEKQTTKQDQ